MLGVKLQFNEFEKVMINTSLDEMTKSMSISQRKLYKITKSKINNPKKVMDGMDMRNIENSLIKRCSSIKDPKIKSELNALAKKIEKRRLQFQYSATKERRAALGI